MERTAMSQPASRIALAFMIAAAACLVVGVGMGVAMGIAHDFSLTPVHAHLNLLGWASLALMGLTYRAWPVLAANRVAAVTQFVLSAASAMVFPAGIYISVNTGQPIVAIVSSLVWLAGAVLFLGRLVVLAMAGDQDQGQPAMPAARRA